MTCRLQTHKKSIIGLHTPHRKKLSQYQEAAKATSSPLGAGMTTLLVYRPNQSAPEGANTKPITPQPLLASTTTNRQTTWQPHATCFMSGHAFVQQPLKLQSSLNVPATLYHKLPPPMPSAHLASPCHPPSSMPPTLHTSQD